MAVGQGANQGRSDSLEQAGLGDLSASGMCGLRVWYSREERAHSSSQQDNIISGLDRSRKGMLVAIERRKKPLKESRMAGICQEGRFAVAIERE